MRVSRSALSNFLFLLGFAAQSTVFGSSTLSVSSVSATPGTSVQVAISLQSGSGQTQGLQWTLSVPSGTVTAFSTVAGDAAIVAGKTMNCAGNTCVLSGMNATPIGNGVVALVNLSIASTATGSIPVQLTTPLEALTDGTGGVVSVTSGAVSLPQPSITMSVSPLASSISASQSQQFTASVTGSSNTGVSWSLNPAAGAISPAGFYTAPPSISVQQNVTVTATSAADPTRSASAMVTLSPAVGISISPLTSGLSSSQTQQFTASVTGSTNTGVTWSLNPAAGAISGAGLYTAPSGITTQQNVTVTATSAADPTRSASAVISLNPPAAVSVSISPTAVRLYGSQPMQFNAYVSGSINQSVMWSIIVPAGSTYSPQIYGTLSNTGLYTAPADVQKTLSFSIRATSVVDVTASADVTSKLSPKTLH
jgi:hypothetical protein